MLSLVLKMVKMNTNWRLLVSIFLCCLSGILRGQTQRVGDLDILSIPLERNGGSAAVPSLFCVGNDGFPWYTTANGIVKDYGTEQFVHTLVSQRASSDVNTFYDIFEDSRNMLWVGTSSGLYQFNESTGEGTWHQWENPETDEIAAIIDVAEANNGDIVMATSKNYGLRYIVKEDRLISYRIPDEHYEISPLNQNIVDYYIKIEETRADNSIIVSQFHNFFLFKDGKATLLRDYTNLRLQGTQQFSLELVQNGLFFPAGTKGKYSFKGQTYQYDFIPEIDRQIIQLPSRDFEILDNRQFSISDYKALVVGKNLAGRNSLDFYGISQETFEMSAVIPTHTFDRAIVHLGFTKTSPIYVSTIGEAYKVNYVRSRFHTNLSHEQRPESATRVSVRGFSSDSKGNVYMGTYAGLFKRDVNGTVEAIRIPRPKDNDQEYIGYRALYVQNDSILWNAGEHPSLDKINLKTKKTDEYRLPSVRGSRHNSCQTMIVLPDGDILVGTTGGLYRFNPVNEQFTDESQLSSTVSLKNIAIKELFYEPDVLWIGSVGAGIFRKDLRSGNVEHFSVETTQGNLPSDIIYVIHKAMNGSYYFGTQKGIAIYDPVTSKIETIREEDGIADEVIVGITEDDQGIWIGTFNGLTCYLKEDDWFYNFYVKDGLPNNEFNQESFFKDTNGRMYFGGLDGFVTFKTQDVTFEKPNASIKIIKAEYYDSENENLVTNTFGVSGQLKALELSYERPFFNLSYAISDTERPEDATFEYKIIGLNDRWISLENATNLRINAMPPGDYLLRLRGDDSSGNPTINEVQLPIKISQVFYKTWWFIGLNILGLAFLLIGFYEFRKYRWGEKFRQQRKVDQLEAKALRAQMNPHFMFNALNGLQSIMILKGEREANQYLGSFSKLLRSSLDMSRTDMISLEEEIDYLGAYLDLEKLRQARPLAASITLIPEDLDTSSINIPCMLFQPIVENAILHGLSPKREGLAQIKITFEEHKGELVGTVIDNGIGREAAIALRAKNKKIHKSWATKILAERIEIINRYTDENVDLKIVDLYEDHKATGTKVTLKLPLQ